MQTFAKCIRVKKYKFNQLFAVCSCVFCLKELTLQTFKMHSLALLFSTHRFHMMEKSSGESILAIIGQSLSRWGVQWTVNRNHLCGRCEALKILLITQGFTVEYIHVIGYYVPQLLKCEIQTPYSPKPLLQHASFHQLPFPPRHLVFRNAVHASLYPDFLPFSSIIMPVCLCCGLLSAGPVRFGWFTDSVFQ